MSEKSVRDVLVEARGLIARGWTRNVAARNAFGVPCEPVSADATCFCAIGAVERATSNGGPYCAATAALYAAAGQPVAAFNDASSDKRRVLRLFDRAIAACEATSC